MSNSSLASYARWSPNCSIPRAYGITHIIPHHVAGKLSLEQLGEGFADPNRQASAHYGIDVYGNIAQYVDEANMAWTTANWDIDNRAVTIEVANDEVGGDWHVSDASIKALINLCVDICRRNGISSLNFTGDRSGNLVMHRYYYPTACPGDYLASQFPYIAAEVNKRLRAQEKGWKNDSTGWWYQNPDGSYPKNTWVEVDGKWSYFDWRGYAYQSRWLAKTEGYYYLDSACYMVTGWTLIDNKWYYFLTETTKTAKGTLPKGLMLKGWQLINGYWYWLGADGVMRTGWQQIKEKWYYFSSSGAMCTGWIQNKGYWYYLDKETGEMKTGYFKDKDTGNTYYLREKNDGKPLGSMYTGWKLTEGKYSYFTPERTCQPTGSQLFSHWIKEKGKLYWIEEDGYMACNKTLEIQGFKYSFNSSGEATLN